MKSWEHRAASMTRAAASTHPPHETLVEGGCRCELLTVGHFLVIRLKTAGKWLTVGMDLHCVLDPGSFRLRISFVSYCSSIERLYLVASASCCWKRFFWSLLDISRCYDNVTYCYT